MNKIELTIHIDEDVFEHLVSCQHDPYIDCGFGAHIVLAVWAAAATEKRAIDRLNGVTA